MRQHTTLWIAVLFALVSLNANAADVPPADGGLRPPARGSKTVAVRRGDLAVTVQAIGTLQPGEEVEVGALAPGVVTRVHADFRSVVQQGEVLFEIDDGPYRADHELQRAGLARAQAELALAKAKHDLANRSAQRIRKIAGDGAAPRSELDDAEANLVVAEGGIRIAEASIAQAQALVQRAERMLDQTRVRSPIAGVVLSRRVTVGQYASPEKGAAFRIASDLSKMRLEFQVSQHDVVTIKPGQAASFTCDAFPGKTFPATVTGVRLDPVIARERATFPVIAAEDNPKQLLLPYLTVRAPIETDRRQNVLTVPAAAVVEVPRGNGRGREPRRVVWVAAGDDFRAVDVEVGASDGTSVEIRGEGISEGVSVAESAR
jgi:HlyD family secretion protein